jgi:hypothetical protein
MNNLRRALPMAVPNESDNRRRAYKFVGITNLAYVAPPAPDALEEAIQPFWSAGPIMRST